MVEPFVSVVVCTYNRVDFLQKCLESLLQQRNALPFEIIIVDNNSNDGTANFVHSFSEKSKLPIHYVFEPIQGLSRARNAGVKAARGELVAFLDDDATATENWVHAIEDGASKFPEFAVQSGPVQGVFEAPRPTWLSSKLDSAISIGNFPAELREKKTGELMFGGNMAIRRDVFDRMGGFSETLGHIGKSLLAAEEVEYCDRLKRNNYKILNNPNMEILHWVPKSRLVKLYVRSRMYWNGRSLAIWDHLRRRPIILRTLGRIFYTIPRDSLGMIVKWGKEDEKFYYSCQLEKHFGYILQALEFIAKT